jgi:hypothetical protein
VAGDPPPAPGRTLAVDWSGAARGEERILRVATTVDGIVESVRAATREQAGDLLVDAAHADPGLVAGLDFSFSTPAWWLDACGIAGPAELWADAGRLERWLADCRPPFWGRPGRRRPPTGGDPLRLTERCAPGTPGSVFQVGGAGAVGTASLRGMPTLTRLRKAGFAVWPFDPWRSPVVVEVWPRLAIGPLVKSSPAARGGWVRTRRGRLSPGAAAAARHSPDALDAAAAALWLADHPFPGPAADDPVVDREGWIAGVEAPPATPAGRR